MYTRMLVATGRRPWSDAALPYALTLAQHLGAELRLLALRPAVMRRSRVHGEAPLAPPTESLVGQGSIHLACATAYATDIRIRPARLCSWDAIPETIAQAAEAEDCDLIVVGGHSMTGLKRRWLGDPLQALATKAQSPILVVKRPPPPPVGVMPWRRILVATTSSSWSDAAVDYGFTLAWLHDLELCFLHVDDARSKTDVDGDADSGKNRLARAEARAAALGLSCNGVLAAGNPVSAIVKTARRRQCDVIILGAHRMRGWQQLIGGHIANAVAAKGVAPVLLAKRFIRL